MGNCSEICDMLAPRISAACCNTELAACQADCAASEPRVHDLRLAGKDKEGRKKGKQEKRGP